MKIKLFSNQINLDDNKDCLKDYLKELIENGFNARYIASLEGLPYLEIEIEDVSEIFKISKILEKELIIRYSPKLYYEMLSIKKIPFSLRKRLRDTAVTVYDYILESEKS